MKKNNNALVPASLCLLLFFLLFDTTRYATAQGAPVFNRFQYHKYTWNNLHTSAFHILYPRGYDSLASFASVQLPDIMTEVKAAMGIGFSSDPRIIIYPSPDQLYESNVGFRDNKPQTFPTINLKGGRVLVAFNGSLEHFRLQLKEAWVRLCWEEQFKNDAEQQLTNRKELIPSWFKKGSIRYFTSGWTAEDEWQYEAHAGKASYHHTTILETDEALAGQSFCYFLAQRYGETTPRQVLFQLRHGKTLNKALRLVTKRRLDTLQAQSFAFYQQRFQGTTYTGLPVADSMVVSLEHLCKGRWQTSGWNKDSTALYFVIRKDNRREAYILRRDGLPLSGRNLKPFFRYTLPPWLDDHEKDIYPVMRWNDNGKALSLIVPVKGQLVLQQYNLAGQLTDSRILYGVDGVNSLAWWDRYFLLSAYRKGRSDIVSYDPQKMRYQALTAGQADHTELALSAQQGSVAYRSGYPADSLYHRDTMARPYGIYTLPLQAGLKNIARTHDEPAAKDSAYVTWKYPEYTAGGTLTALTTRSGRVERGPLTEGAAGAALTPWLQEYLAAQQRKDSIRSLLQRSREQEVSFLKKVLNPGDTKAAAALHEDSLRREMAYTPKKVKPYVLQLFSAYFSAQINNDYYINRYQPFQAYLGTFKFPEVGAMAQGGFSDLLDNHHFNIGYRLPAGTEGSDFFVRYENTARKLDWHLSFFRKVESLQPDALRDWKDNSGNPYPQAAKVRTHYYELGFHYPLRYDWSLDFTTAARRDRTIFLATDRYSLNYEALQSWWSISTLSSVIQRLQPTIPFLYKGWEARAAADLMASTGKPSSILYGLQAKLAYHQPLFKDITLVAQVQGGYSGGESKILYNFGGLDHNVVPRVDTSVRFGQTAPYAFQTLVTPFRGYAQNSIYGSRYGLVNVDIYFPLFRSLIPLKTGFSAVNNLQLGLFADIAAAGGAYPAVNAVTSLHAWGFSARTMLAGYPIRFDMAWPGSFNDRPVWYLSLAIR